MRADRRPHSNPHTTCISSNIRMWLPIDAEIDSKKIVTEADIKEILAPRSSPKNLHSKNLRILAKLRRHKRKLKTSSEWAVCRHLGVAWKHSSERKKRRENGSVWLGPYIINQSVGNGLHEMKNIIAVARLSNKKANIIQLKKGTHWKRWFYFKKNKVWWNGKTSYNPLGPIRQKLSYRLVLCAV